jgi:Fe-S cluster biogenesis protein NfuA
MASEDEDHIHIMAAPTPNPESLKFTVDRPVLDEGSVYFPSPEDDKDSPLAKRIFALGKLRTLFVVGNMITATKESDADWGELAKPIGTQIREHLLSGDPTVVQTAADQSERNETEQKIEGVLAEIRPYVQNDGGDIVFAGYTDGVVQVFMQGACSGCPSSTATLRQGIEQRLKEVIPEIKEVVPI